MSQNKVFEATVEEVHSGDDFILMVSLGVEGLYIKKRCRLHGVDAPNAYRAKADTEAGLVREEVRRLVGSGRLFIEVVAEGRGGWIVRMNVVPPSGEPVCINSMLRDRGYIYSNAQDGKHETTAG